MTEPGSQLAMQSEAAQIVSGLLQKQTALIDRFVAALESDSVRDLSQLLSVSAQPESGSGAAVDAELSPDVQAAISEAITQQVEPMIDELLAELEGGLDEDETVDEEVIDQIIGQLVEEYLNEIRNLLGL